jgi:hypothetical protein
LEPWFRTFRRHFSDPKMVDISVCSKIKAIIEAPKVSYSGTVVIPRRFAARSVVTHSLQFTDVIPSTLSVLPGYSPFLSS